MPSTRPLRERLLEKLILDPESGCLLWSGSINNKGYGRINVDGRVRYVHRVMYELFVGPIPDGLQIDHVKARGCANRNCGSPSHLEPVTASENQQRGSRGAVTHCPAGHAYDELNTYRKRNGTRTCRACHRERARRVRHFAGAEDWETTDEQ